MFARCWLLTKDIEQQCCKITTAQTSLVIIRTQLKHGARCSVKAFLHRSAVHQQLDRYHQTDKPGGGHSSPNSLDLLCFSTQPSYMLVTYALYGLRACAGRTRKWPSSQLPFPAAVVAQGLKDGHPYKRIKVIKCKASPVLAWKPSGFSHCSASGSSPDLWYRTRKMGQDYESALQPIKTNFPFCLLFTIHPCFLTLDPV